MSIASLFAMAVLVSILTAEASATVFSSAPEAFRPDTLNDASTNAFTDCCVGISVALLEEKSSSSAKPVIVIVPSDNEPKVTVPVVVIADDPLFIAPNPVEILPLFNAPVVTRFGIAVISSSKYAAKSVTATCFIVPSSLTTTLSASAIVVLDADVSPSITFNSVAVTVAPSSIFNSDAVDVTPSSMFSSSGVDVI